MVPDATAALHAASSPARIPLKAAGSGLNAVTLGDDRALVVMFHRSPAMKTPAFLSMLVVLSLGAACDRQDGTTPTERIATAIEQADVALAEAIATAETESAGVAIKAELEPEHGATIYRVELIGAAGQRRLEIDPQDGSVLRSRDSSSGNAEDNAAAGTFATGAAWAQLIGAAEAEVSGIAFEIDADAKDGVFEVKVLVDSTVFEVDVSPTGEIVKVEQDDDFDDNAGDDDGQDDDTGGEDHHGGNDDGSSDDGGTGEDHHGGESESSDDNGTDDGSDDNGTDDGSDDNGTDGGSDDGSTGEDNHGGGNDDG
jgi:uncharacterized membrane protein YkoI